MIQKTLTYVDYNDDKVTETLHFHITKSELMDNLSLQDELEALKTKFEGEAHELNSDEVSQILGLVKRLVQLSYGVRSEDGKRFRKSESMWLDFKDSAAYDAVLWSMFETPDEALSFMAGILPKDLMEKAAAENAVVRPMPQDHLKPVPQAVVELPGEAVVPFDDAAVEVAPATVEDSVEDLRARLAARLKDEDVRWMPSP